MSILETFYILFKSNAKDVKKDTAEAKKAVDEFEGQIKKTDQSTAALGLSFQKLALAGIAALTGFDALRSIKDAITNTANYNLQIEKQTRLTGLNAKELEAWDDVVQQAGGSTGAFSNWITELSDTYQKAGLGDKIKDIIPGLKEFARQIRGLDDQSALSLGQKLQIPRDVVLAIRGAGDNLDYLIDRQMKLRESSEEGTKSVRAFATAWSQSTAQISDAATRLGNIVFPILTYILDALNTPIPIPDWLSKVLPDFIQVPIVKEQIKSSINAPPASGNAPLGIRTNNPGNLRPGGRQAVYGSLEEGIEAEKNLLKKYAASGRDTLAEIAMRWAPPNENNTRAYIADLAKTTGFNPNQKLNLDDPNVMAAVANAINKHENGAAYGNMIATQPASNISKSVSVGTITINTQATDADGIANSLSASLNQHFATTIGNYDDGVKY